MQKHKKARKVKLLIVFELIFCCLLCIFVSACTAKDEGVQYLIGLSQPNLSDNMQLAIKMDVQNRCKAYENARCISYDAGFNVARQSEDIDRLLNLGVDALVVVTFEPEKIAEAIAKAYDTGTPVIIIGYAPENGKFTTRIYTDNKKIGGKVGVYVKELVKEKPCIVLEVLGDSESMMSKDQRDGFRNAIKSASNIKKEFVMTGYWSQDKTLQRFKESEFYKKSPPIDLIIAQNDSMAIGAAIGVKDYGRDITIIGVGGFPIQNSDLEALNNGQIDATFSYPPGGKESVDAAIKHLNGETVPRLIELQSTLVTKLTVEDFIAKEWPAGEENNTVASFTTSLCTGILQANQ